MTEGIKSSITGKVYTMNEIGQFGREVAKRCRNKEGGVDMQVWCYEMIQEDIDKAVIFIGWHIGEFLDEKTDPKVN